MDIFNRPPAISEDTLQYALYPPPNQSDRVSATSLATCIHEFVNSLLADFLWHRDAFEMKVSPDPSGAGWYLDGRMRVGDCVDDEWCVVWLLKQISAKWDVVISVFDSDGEFMLIEAADALPVWVKPTNSENRVWIYESQIHLVPISYVSPPSRKRRRRKLPATQDSEDDDEDVDDEYIAAEDALKLVRDLEADTRAPLKVQEIIWARIGRYPTALRDHIHVAKAWLPVDVAKALSVNPTFVQKPVETFYTRDAVQLRAAHKMTWFPPEPAVLTTVKMTRTAYAQLVGQKFYPPKVFGRVIESEGSREWRWRDIGVKIACGFEMLYQESKGRINNTNTSNGGQKSVSVGDFLNRNVLEENQTSVLKESLRRDADYAKYIGNLKSARYFKNEVEGSQLWNLLEDKAAAAYLKVRQEDNQNRPGFASLIQEAISQAPKFTQARTTVEEDSDDWLNVDAKDFDSMLEQKLGKQGTSESQRQQALETAGEDQVAGAQASKLQELAEKVKDFVEGEGDVEGARFEDEEFSDEEFNDDSESEEEAKRQEDMDNLVPKLDAKEYGQMPPSFHRNSQRVTKIVDSEDEESEENNPSAQGTKTEYPTRPTRRLNITRDKYDGVDSDDETDEEEDIANEDGDEEQPEVVGEIEVDMGEEEDEFLEFSRHALGINDEQWHDMLKVRKERGAFVPLTYAEHPPPEGPVKPGHKATDVKVEPTKGFVPNLDSFEAVMNAMDVELARSKKGVTNDPARGQAKGKGKAVVAEGDEEVDELGDGLLAAMDAELKAALNKDMDVDEEDESEAPMDYNLIKNFLESFKTQGGLPGPVSNLAGRLQGGWQLPRDES